MTPYPIFRDQIAQAVDARCYPIEWIDAQVWSGHFRVWGNDKACLLTSIRHFPTGAYEVHVEVAAGDLDALMGDIIQQVEAFSKEIGALWTTIESRMAWAKLMKPHGYEVDQVKLRKAT